MRFQKDNKYGFTTEKEQPLTASVSLRVDKELATKLKSIPGWQDKARNALNELIQSWNAES
ncbi:hypothetical protein DSM106972_057590 [Dulcicalothrix desertica PCC 7102]|uniref:Uncharacterized protein n=1 Tax=Dulcicalothrix desertica PCC 7102 TaxID=232991 RepID=A0A433V9X3_9CYAN|nr:hypothetical protein [Dulcicalothrix desertica]RUT02839.1 hypothetical protein DSM106972_057590 [Dulcicalothrix desertica PCC 7102]TWH38928.1 hypothetical protein CAL7102_08125 [Dulcicalothrix desertica PCC 7102]